MTPDSGISILAEKLETLILQDPGQRGLICPQTRPLLSGKLQFAAAKLAKLGTNSRVAVFTGFPILDANPVAPESDGPPGSEWLAECILGILNRGRSAPWEVAAQETRIFLLAESLTTQLFAEQPGVQIVSLPCGAEAVSVVESLPALEVFISIERVGLSYETESPKHAKYYSMRGVNIASAIAHLDDFVEAFQGVSIAIGDGGNEIGMGVLPRDVIAQLVKGGAKIASKTRSDALIASAISNWGAYALGSLAWSMKQSTDCDKSRSQKIAEWTAIFQPIKEQRRLERMLERGVIDGVTRQSKLSVDGLDWNIQKQCLCQIDQFVREFLDSQQT